MISISNVDMFKLFQVFFYKFANLDLRNILKVYYKMWIITIIGLRDTWCHPRVFFILLFLNAYIAVTNVYHDVCMFLFCCQYLYGSLILVIHAYRRHLDVSFIDTYLVWCEMGLLCDVISFSAWSVLQKVRKKFHVLKLPHYGLLCCWSSQ